MKLKPTFLLFGLLFMTNIYACECECLVDCSFEKVSQNSEFVALIKVISYDDYLSSDIMNYKGKMPYSMTVEIIKKYKGKETRKKIKIWGDNGALCRPYISHFKINEYYLIAPNLLGESHLQRESPTDFEVVSCITDYLKVDIKNNIAYGEYSKTLNEISLKKFSKYLKKNLSIKTK